MLSVKGVNSHDVRLAWALDVRIWVDRDVAVGGCTTRYHIRCVPVLPEIGCLDRVRASQGIAHS